MCPMTETPRTTALGELYASITQANDWSMRDVARRIDDRSGGLHSLSKTRIGQLVNANPLPSITAEVIDALAVGLGVSSHRVARAAIESMGYRVAGDDLTPAEAINRDESLSEPTRAALLSILRDVERRRTG